jgi:DNA-binding NtrC family response regulator
MRYTWGVTRGETTIDGEGITPIPGEPSQPLLILALTDRGRRLDERCGLLDGGVLLGRDALLFPGGILDDPRLSRRHAEVRRKRGGWVVQDLGSRNGTFVNGVRVDGERPLDPGSVLRIGSTLIVFALAAPDETAGIAPELIGQSAALAATRRSIAATPARGTVLVTGETGTGKELVAAALHKQGGRNGELVAVNCGTLSEGLLASELFGHVRGAFTGATSDRPGLFRAADRGTLFLDEIGELPPAHQVSLLRVLENRAVRPVGGVEDVPVDVTVIAATHRDLAEQVRRGRFRADLFARLSPWSIHLPPLRERREDIPALVVHLLARHGAAGRALSPGLMEALLFHPWPLNVRGLSNVLSAAVLAARGGSLDLGPEVARALETSRALAAEEPAAPPEAPEAGEPSDERVLEVLTRRRGHVAAAATELGCSRQHLYRRMTRLGRDAASFRKDD